MASETKNTLIKPLGLCLLLAAIAVEIIGIGAWLVRFSGWAIGPDLSLLQAIGLHLACNAVGALAVRLICGPDKGPVLAWLSLIIGLATPVLGLPVMAAIFCLAGIEKFRQGVFDEYREYIAKDAENVGKEEFRPLDDVVNFLMGELSVEPLADLINSEDPNMRRAAIDVLRKLKNPLAIRMLTHALQDPNPEVRVYATGALGRIDKEMTDVVEKASQRVKASPKDTEKLIALAEAYLAYVHSGLLDKESIDYYLDFALDPVNKALKKQPNNTQALEILGRIYLQRQAPDQAQVAFAKMVEHDKNSLSGLIGLAETLFEQGNIERLSQACKTILATPGSNELDRETQEALEMWST